jgi:hypothetical protein
MEITPTSAVTAKCRFQQRQEWTLRRKQCPPVAVLQNWRRQGDGTRQQQPYPHRLAVQWPLQRPDCESSGASAQQRGDTAATGLRKQRSQRPTNGRHCSRSRRDYGQRRTAASRYDESCNEKVHALHFALPSTCDFTSHRGGKTEQNAGVLLYVRAWSKAGLDTTTKPLGSRFAQLAACFSWFFLSLSLLPWMRRHYMPPKLTTVSELYGVATQKIVRTLQKHVSQLWVWCPSACNRT